MLKKLPLSLVVLALLAATLACGLFTSTPAKPGISNARTALDQDANTPTTLFSPGNDFYVVFDMTAGVTGQEIIARWYAEENPGDGATYMFYEQNYVLDQDYSGTQPVYFQIYNTEGDWPSGAYKVELYLDGALQQTVDFSVQ